MTVTRPRPGVVTRYRQPCLAGPGSAAADALQETTGALAAQVPGTILAEVIDSADHLAWSFEAGGHAGLWTDGSGQHGPWEIRNQVGEDAGSMGDRAPGPAADGRSPRGPRQTCPRCGSARWVFYGRLMWAYAIERWDPAADAAESRLQGMLMERGAEEWELVTALTMPDGASLLTFKRPS